MSTWIEDPSQPSGWRWVNEAPGVVREQTTTMWRVESAYPATFTPTPPAVSGFETEDGSWYARLDPDEFSERASSTRL